MPCTPHFNRLQEPFPKFYPCFQTLYSLASTTVSNSEDCQRSEVKAVINIIPILFHHCCSVRLTGLSQIESLDHENDDV